MKTKHTLFLSIGLILTGAICFLVANMVHFFVSANPYIATLTLIAIATPVALYWFAGAIYLGKHNNANHTCQHTGVYKQ